MADALLISGWIRRPDGVELFWERYGSGSAPALFLHGGPGSGLSSHYRSYFDPNLHTVVAFDQRGCGRSVPSVVDDLQSLVQNTTQRLIEDIEALREDAGIGRWLVVGLSWGATLGLAYAQAHPDRVSGLVLGAVTTTSRDEVQSLTQDLRHVFPEQWGRLAAVAHPVPGERLVEALYRGIISPDHAERQGVATAWGEWEETHPSLDANFVPSPRWQDPRRSLEMATLVLHYWSHHAFLGEAGIMNQTSRLAGIPGTMVHGRLDISSTMSVPSDLSQSWPDSTLIEIDGEGHFGEQIFRTVKDAVRQMSERP
ncbi:alpha/beta fold hydrolase [Microbacterium gallinarum]|uniref:alpha/beta fold hydrolase n=1 Tax=Microbacterium gallinarum TaxID=2762209 RepID=UPI0029700275|nr:alpha/beta fold hydrolase [Microbacterium gallinarum]